MRWPWQRKTSGDRLILSWRDQTLAYVRANVQGQTIQIIQAGVVNAAPDDPAMLARSLMEQGLKGHHTVMLLGVDQYQLLQIDTPNVPPEELRAAARYQVRDLLPSHVDDYTLDVVKVGDGRAQGGNHSFVVAAPSETVTRLTQLATALEADLTVIDVKEMAIRNLQTALAQRDGTLEQANAALVMLPHEQAVLTFAACGELFYSRRFDLPADFWTSHWSHAVAPQQAVDGYTPVQEYVPAHAAGDITLDSEFMVDTGSVPVPHSTNEQSMRLVLEVQRSLDVWSRTWSTLPLSGLRVHAGTRTAELSDWLMQQLGQPVRRLDVAPVFQGLDAIPVETLDQCLPLLGVLLRQEGAS